jgi:hypothetical protein
LRRGAATRDEERGALWGCTLDTARRQSLTVPTVNSSIIWVITLEMQAVLIAPKAVMVVLASSSCCGKMCKIRLMNSLAVCLCSLNA